MHPFVFSFLIRLELIFSIASSSSCKVKFGKTRLTKSTHKNSNQTGYQTAYNYETVSLHKKISTNYRYHPCGIPLKHGATLCFILWHLPPLGSISHDNPIASLFFPNKVIHWKPLTPLTHKWSSWRTESHRNMHKI